VTVGFLIRMTAGRHTDPVKSAACSLSRPSCPRWVLGLASVLCLLAPSAAAAASFTAALDFFFINTKGSFLEQIEEDFCKWNG